MNLKQLIVFLVTAVILSACGGGSNSLPNLGPSSLLIGQLGGIAVNSAGTELYVSDYGLNIIESIPIAGGTFSTIAGISGIAGSINGAGTSALFNGPMGLALTIDGNGILVADTNNSGIREVTVASPFTVSNFAGMSGSYGFTDGTGTAALFGVFSPTTISSDGINDYAVVDQANSTIRSITASTGAVTTIAGLAGHTGSVDGSGKNALFNFPYGITFASGTNMFYVTDEYNHTIRSVTSTGVVTTIAGYAGVSGSNNATGAGSSGARFYSPTGITTDGNNLYVVDTNNNLIRKIVISTGAVTTLAGSGAIGFTDGTGTSASFNFYTPSTIVYSTNGYLYVIDQSGTSIRKIGTGNTGTTAGAVTTLGI